MVWGTQLWHRQSIRHTMENAILYSHHMTMGYMHRGLLIIHDIIVLYCMIDIYLMYMHQMKCFLHPWFCSHKYITRIHTHVYDTVHSGEHIMPHLHYRKTLNVILMYLGTVKPYFHSYMINTFITHSPLCCSIQYIVHYCAVHILVHVLVGICWL